jgi:hypothetical protein
MAFNPTIDTELTYFADENETRKGRLRNRKYSRIVDPAIRECQTINDYKRTFKIETAKARTSTGTSSYAKFLK